ncbi:hypothetical protein pdam_00000611 [Pocillopora damicornis]|uniref:Uncharacterized protein n=1 Tax=Pocillopora damicornis TaxID=46731 RepID=A0A3M6TYF3_POCDA|nr:hypothetical protein pdam_00000611 [Pocillopora damicornis]
MVGPPELAESEKYLDKRDMRPQNTCASLDKFEFLAWTLSRCKSSSALYFSASRTMRSISSLDNLPLSLVMVILFSRPVLLSTAETFKIPFASMS